MDYKKNPNIGTFIFANNKVAIIPEDTPKNEYKIIGEYLGVRVIKAKIYETELLGVYTLGNDEKIIIPDNIDLLIGNEKDVNYLNENFKIYKLNTKNNALSNNFALVKDYVIANKEFEKTAKDIADILNYKTLILNEKINVIGTLIKANDYGALLSPLLSKEAVEKIKEEILKNNPKFKLVISTINDENEYIGTSLVVNNRGVLLGNKTKGFEIINVEDAFKPG